MRPSLRFLAVAVIGWAGVRAYALGVLPGVDLFRIEPSEAKAPPIVQTQFSAVEPVEPATPLYQAQAQAPIAQPIAVPPAASNVRYVQAVVGVQVPMRPGVVTVYQLPAASPAAPRHSPRFAETPIPPGYTSFAPLGAGPLEQLASLWPMSRSHSSAPESLPAAPVPPLDAHKLDRLQLSTWALLRTQQTGIAGSQSLAAGGQLGASQAGARLLYNLNRRFALSARLSSPVGKRGGEAAAGVRVQPLLNIPIWLTAERRQAIGKYGGGRSAFAFFLEGGLYEHPLPWRFSLDTYLQGGVVGLKSRDLFIDGGLTVTRQLFKQFSAGFGVWGGAQPGLYRVDAGPRLTMRVRKNVRLHFDWRQKLAGNARPGSGPALTLAGDF
jgi:hypothetical protein